MKYKNRKRGKIILDYMLGWTLAFLFLSIVRGVGTTENGTLKFDFLSSLLISLTMGPIMGAISGFAQILTFERIYKRISIQRLLMVRLLYTFLFVLLLIIVAYGVYQFYFGTEMDIITFAFDEGSFAIYFYIIFVDLFMAVLSQVNLLLGEKNLARLLRGKFYTPREEEKIFMFIDLQSSTQLAERLGHIRYSQLIQDCFNDLGVVVENGAEVYQYVGDEVILTWKLSEGLKYQNCLQAFFNFKQHLKSRTAYYQEKYGVDPFFKAGLHAGIVTVTEVGRYKKEIAYHGDTINTTARIQGKCNEFGAELLISGDLKNRLDNHNFIFSKLGEINLRGKEKEVSIYSVAQTN